MNKQTDERYLSIRGRLEKLPTEALQRFLEYRETICYDEYNYRKIDGAFCPLSIMLSIDSVVKQENIIPSQDIILSLLKTFGGEAFGTVKGVAGEFYRENRKNDLRELCKTILDERSKSFGCLKI